MGGGGGGTSLGSVPVAADGTFTIRNVPPGEFTLRVGTPTGTAGRQETASLPIIVAGVDIDNISMITSAGWSVTGQIMTENGAAPSVPRDRIRVAGRMLVGRSPAAGRGQVKDDWTFSLTDIVGPARLAADLPDGWMVKAVVHNGRDITDTPVEMKSGEEISGVQVIVTGRVTTVTGQLLDNKGAPLADGTVIVFPTESEKWAEDSRFVRGTRPDLQGQYQMRGLPAGEYLAVAIDYVQDGMWNDPEYLESIRRYGQKLTLGDSESQSVFLKLVTP